MEKLFKIPRYYVVEKAFWFYFSYSFKLCEWILKNFTVLWLKISTVLCLETLWNWVWLFSVVKKFFLFESSRFSIEFQIFWWLCNTEGALLEWKSSLKCIEAWSKSYIVSKSQTPWEATLFMNEAYWESNPKS